jgi:3-hydroxymyristoyl/3-hydroxydecanoyl-(acyl carrier protein) dehydratase
MAAEHHLESMVPADHPSLPGHFPGNPIVPGVLMLDRVVAAVLDAAPAGRKLRLVGVPSIKFVRALKPGEPFDIYWSPVSLPEPGTSRFRCESRGQLLAQGTLSFADG